MNKIALNIKFKMGYQFTWALWYLVIYITVMALLSYGLIKADLINSRSGGLVYRIWGVILFQFAISLRFKEDFDFMLTLSNTRKEIFQSLLGVALAFSTIFSGLIILERLMVDALNNLLGFQNFTDPFHFVSPYVTDNLFIQYLFFLMLCVCCSILGILIGSLFYRFGKLFRLAFWTVIVSTSILIIPLLLWSLYQQNDLTRFITDTGVFFKNFNLLASSGYLLILTIAFSIGAYVNILKLPQK
ncbi:MAG: hypothetical protein DWQ04_03630 [Chloroflexi bacterium]|nr:MAG: hypothetical protein DWQ04_03630 [Chloroflexota bacterium]